MSTLTIMLVTLLNVFLTTGVEQEMKSAISRIESKLTVVDTKLEILGLKGEAATLRKESKNLRFETMLDTMYKQKYLKPTVQPKVKRALKDYL